MSARANSRTQPKATQPPRDERSREEPAGRDAAAPKARAEPRLHPSASERCERGSASGGISTARFRQALGHFCTGVTVVTATDGGEPVGFACQSFAALSLDPPLVLFCPARTSGSWPRIERAGRFCVNVLSHAQRDVSSLFGTAGTDRFGAVGWTAAPSGAPILSGVITWIDCAVETVQEAGDHYVVVGRVTALGEPDGRRPLLFYRGAYTVTEVAEPTPGILDNLITWSRADDWI